MAAAPPSAFSPSASAAALTSTAVGHAASAAACDKTSEDDQCLKKSPYQLAMRQAKAVARSVFVSSRLISFQSRCPQMSLVECNAVIREEWKGKTLASKLTFLPCEIGSGSAARLCTECYQPVGRIPVYLNGIDNMWHYCKSCMRLEDKPLLMQPSTKSENATGSVVTAVGVQVPPSRCVHCGFACEEDLHFFLHDHCKSCGFTCYTTSNCTLRPGVTYIQCCHCVAMISFWARHPVMHGHCAQCGALCMSKTCPLFGVDDKNHPRRGSRCLIPERSVQTEEQATKGQATKEQTTKEQATTEQATKGQATKEEQMGRMVEKEAKQFVLADAPNNQQVKETGRMIGEEWRKSKNDTDARRPYDEERQLATQSVAAPGLAPVPAPAALAAVVPAPARAPGGVLPPVATSEAVALLAAAPAPTPPAAGKEEEKQKTTLTSVEAKKMLHEATLMLKLQTTLSDVVSYLPSKPILEQMVMARREAQLVQVLKWLVSQMETVIVSHGVKTFLFHLRDIATSVPEVPDAIIAERIMQVLPQRLVEEKSHIQIKPIPTDAKKFVLCWGEPDLVAGPLV